LFGGLDIEQSTSNAVEAPVSSQFSVNLQVDSISTHHVIPSKASNTTNPLPAALQQAEAKLNGLPEEILDLCCADVPIQYEATWHCLKDIERFFICTRCYTDHIAMTQFSAEFTKVQQPPNTKRICVFNNPKMLHHLWPQAIQSGDLSSVRSHVQHLAKLSVCPGVDGIIEDDRTKWLSPKSKELEEILICEACFEDKVATTSLQDHFEVTNSKPSPPATWSCVMALDAIKNAFKLFSVKENGWSQFVEAVNDRVTQLNYNANFIIGNGSGQAFKAKRGPKEFVICPTCYSDYMQYSVFSFEFEETTSLASGTESVCGMNIFSMLTAWNRAVARNDFDLWIQAARMTSNNPYCLASDTEKIT
jgi:hypothetical protein